MSDTPETDSAEAAGVDEAGDMRADSLDAPGGIEHDNQDVDQDVDGGVSQDVHQDIDGGVDEGVDEYGSQDVHEDALDVPDEASDEASGPASEEQPDDHAHASAAESAVGSGVSDEEATGHPAVDAVLASLARLEELPVGEHPPIFEEAHDALRSALAQARDGAPGGPPRER